MASDFLKALSYLFYDSPIRAHAVWKRFGSLNEMIPQLPAYLAQTGSKADTISRIMTRLEDYQNGRLFDLLAQYKIDVITADEDNYPVALKELNDYPLALYLKGNTRLFDEPMLAIVGSRKSTDYGYRMAKRFGELISPYFTVVSGLAEGIDTAAHLGALCAHRPTLAVVGTGLDIVFPSKNKALAQKIEMNGLIVSEYPPEVGVAAFRFPQRNRIISGLVKGVLVIEAGAKSGALITARLAADQGRDVFVIPGAIDTPFSEGSHQLIQEGAKLVYRLSNILEEYAHLEVRNLGGAVKTQDWGFVSKYDRQIIDVLNARGHLGVDDLVEWTGLSVMQVLKSITLLQEKGILQTGIGEKYYIPSDLH